MQRWGTTKSTRTLTPTSKRLDQPDDSALTESARHATHLPAFTTTPSRALTSKQAVAHLLQLRQEPSDIHHPPIPQLTRSVMSMT